MKASIIYNPKAGNKDSQNQIQQAGEFLKKHGWDISWGETQAAGHATELAATAAQNGADFVIAAGGDGTINEVMNGLVHSDSTLGILPAGTGNVFAAELGLPLPNPLFPQSMVKAAESLLHSQTRHIDVARASFDDGTVRHFLLWAGIGLDAAITNAYEADKVQYPNFKSLGMAAWLVSAWFVFWEFRGSKKRLYLDDRTIKSRSIMTIISNTQLYARFWRPSRSAKLDDGFLDVVVMEGYDFRATLKHLYLMTTGNHEQDPDVRTYRTRRIRIETKDPTPIQLDAEAAGMTPVDIEVLPLALKIALPQNAPEKLFTTRKKG